jgi:hypothetical protein
MKVNIKKQLFIYLVFLFFFSIFHLYIKSSVGNDSTISEWLINYTGGFTKRGIIGQICIFFSRLLSSDLREVIFYFQSITIGFYYFLVFNFLKNVKCDRIFLLSIFTPIFLLYPVAEIEVLARKETFLFIIILIYLTISINNKNLINLSKLVLLPLGILIWEPLLFLILFWIAIDIIYYKFEKLDFNFIKNFFTYLPTILLAGYIALNPLSSEEHAQMASILKTEFNEVCYMSCGRLNTASGIIQNFQHNIGKYSFEVFLRYFLIIFIGFGPLFILLINSKLRNRNLFFFKYFKNLLVPFLFILSPGIILFAMGGDWGRYINILYVFSIIFFISLYKNNLILLNKNKIKINFINKVSKKVFIIIFIIFCFGWNPKTVITGDVASFPGYRIPYKFFKIVAN